MKKHVLRYLCICLMALLCSIAVAETDDMPVVFYSGNTVTRAGDVIGVRGEYLEQAWTATMTDGVNTEPVELLQQNRQSFKFQVPENMEEGLLTLNLAGEKPLTIVFNEPKVKWMQGDEGAASTPNGWVRVQGECLRITEDAPITLTLTAADGTVITLIPDQVYDDYSVGFVFSNLANGEYQAVFSNGFAETDCGPLTIAPSPEASWGQKVYDVTKLGVKNDGHSDCTAMVNALLSMLEYRGGGIVYFPAGRYMLTGSITVPKNVTIRGDGPEKTQIFWRDVWRNWTGYDTYELMTLPRVMIQATSDFAIENIEFAGGRMGGLIKAGTKENPAKNVRIENVRVRQDSYAGAVRLGSDTYDAIMDEITDGSWGFMLDINGVNVKIMNCDFMWSDQPMRNGNLNTYFLMQNCTFDDSTAVSRWIASDIQNAIIEGCEIVGHTLGFGGDNFYMSRMYLHDTTRGDREGFTTDVTHGIDFHGVPQMSADKMQYTFPDTVDMSLAKVGAKLCICDGTGAGQWRYVTAIDGHTVTISEPFTVAPDETSEIGLNYMFWNWYMTNCTVEEVGPYQFYVAQGNTVIDNVDIERGVGIISRGWYGYKNEQPNWYMTIVNCDLKNGNVFHQSGWFENNHHSNFEPYLPCNSYIYIHGRNYAERNMGCTIRNCTLTNNCMILIRAEHPESIVDLIIDDIRVQDSNCGIYVEGASDAALQRILIHNPAFENVKEEYHYRTDFGTHW